VERGLACLIFETCLGAEISEMPDPKVVKENGVMPARSIVGYHDRGAIRSAEGEQRPGLKRLAQQKVAVWI
jgi:hypothetical protein